MGKLNNNGNCSDDEQAKRNSKFDANKESTIKYCTENYKGVNRDIAVAAWDKAFTEHHGWSEEDVANITYEYCEMVEAAFKIVGII